MKLDKVGAGILFIDDFSDILLLKRSEICSYSGFWCVPGGKIDKSDYEIDKSFDECVLMGAKRELFEETNIKISYLKDAKFINFIDTYTHYYYRTHIYSISKSDKKIISEELKIDKEHSDWKWENLNSIISNKNVIHPGLIETVSIFLRGLNVCRRK